MSTKYLDAPGVSAIAAELVKHDHPHLVGVEIAYFFFAKYDGKGLLKHPDECGNKVGYARLYPQECRTVLGTPTFGIGILLNWWRWATDEQRVAIVDHELMHCQYDLDTEKPSVRKHDFEGFVDEVQRHGAWDKRLELVKEQMMLAV